MRRISTAVLASLAFTLLLPAGSPATLSEVGVIPSTSPETVPSCPTSPCLAVSRTTGFQTKVGPVGGPLTAPRSGTIVAWTIMLGKPNPTQIKFFDANEGGPPEAGIAILRQVKKKVLTYKLEAQSPTVKLEQYFGKTAQFPLETTISIKKGDLVALTVPTWAPSLALGFGNDTSWRASRQKSQCASTSAQTAQMQVNTALQYFCLYQTARLTYSATLISTP
jgi:hypothetical protein